MLCTQIHINDFCINDVLYCTLLPLPDDYMIYNSARVTWEFKGQELHLSSSEIPSTTYMIHREGFIYILIMLACAWRQGLQGAVSSKFTSEVGGQGSAGGKMTGGSR